MENELASLAGFCVLLFALIGEGGMLHHPQQLLFIEMDPAQVYLQASYVNLRWIRAFTGVMLHVSILWSVGQTVKESKAKV